MLKPGHAGNTEAQMASAGQRRGASWVLNLDSMHGIESQARADPVAFFLTAFSSFLSFLIFFSIFLI